MKVLIFGAGVLGSYYAWKLKTAGVDVDILARGDRLTFLKENPLQLKNYYSKEVISETVTAVSEAELDPEKYDYVLIFVQALHVPHIMPVLKQLSSVKAFVFMGNNTEGFIQPQAELGKERVLAGFGGVGGKREGQIVVYADSVGPGKPAFNQIQLGALGEGQVFLIQKVSELFEKAGITADITENMDEWLKTHAALIAGLAAGLYQYNCDVRELAEDKKTISLVLQAVKEGLTALKRQGYTLRPKKYRFFLYIPNVLLVTQIQRALNSQFAEIGIAGHAQTAKDEMELLIRFIKDSAVKTGLKTPALDYLY